MDQATSNGGKQSAATTPASIAAGDGDQRDQQDAAENLAQPSIDSLPVPDLATSKGGKQSAATTPASIAAGDGDQRGRKSSLQSMIVAAGLPDVPENLPLPSFCKATQQQNQNVVFRGAQRNMLKMRTQSSGELSFSDFVQPQTQSSTDACESDISDSMLLSVLHFRNNEMDCIFKCAGDKREVVCLNHFSFKLHVDDGIHVCCSEKGRSSPFVHGTAIVRSITQLTTFAELCQCRFRQLADTDSKNS